MLSAISIIWAVTFRVFKLYSWSSGTRTPLAILPEWEMINLTLPQRLARGNAINTSAGARNCFYWTARSGVQGKPKSRDESARCLTVTALQLCCFPDFFNSSLITQLAMQASDPDKLSGCWTPPCCPNDKPLQLTDPHKGLLDCSSGLMWGLGMYISDGGCSKQEKLWDRVGKETYHFLFYLPVNAFSTSPFSSRYHSNSHQIRTSAIAFISRRPLAAYRLCVYINGAIETSHALATTCHFNKQPHPAQSHNHLHCKTGERSAAFFPFFK